MSHARTFLQRRPLAEARALVVEGVAPLAAETVNAGDANGRIAAEDVVAKHPAPHYRASAMDGIAVRAADTAGAADAPFVLRAIGADEPAPAGERCCVAVDTGSLLPPWTDAVVRIEDTVAEGDGYRIKSAVAPGRDVRRAGEDIEQGTLVVSEGMRIRPWDIGAMLSTGTTRVAVRTRPRVAILATGGEVVAPEAGAADGQVIESSSRVVAALVEEWGASAHRLGIIGDDGERLAHAVEDAAKRFDVVCVIAGSAAGRKDLTVGVLASLGELVAHGVDIAPGRPVAIARLHRDEVRTNRARTVPAIALPGYPVATIVATRELVEPVVAAMLGAAPVAREIGRATVARAIPSRLGVEEFRRVCLAAQNDGSFVVAPLASGAGSMSTVTGAHAWLRIDATVEGVDAGTDVEVEMIVPLAEARSAFVLAGGPSDASRELEKRLRRSDRRARVRHLGLGPRDALAAVERGEAHAAVVASEGGRASHTPRADAAPFGLRNVEGIAATFAVLRGSAGERMLDAL